MILSNGSLALPQTTAVGELVPNYGATTIIGSHSAIPLAGLWATYSEIYKKQLWVGTVVRKLAMATARNPFDIKRALTGNEQTPEDGPLSALMARPNERLSGFHLWLWTSSVFDIYGEAFWWKLRDAQGTVRELQPIHPTNLTVRTNADGDLEYLYAGRYVIPEADIVPFLNFNPDTARRGLSPLEGLRETLLNEDASRRATASWWNKGARPSVILSHEKNLSEGAVTRLKTQFDSENAGADNMGRTLVVEEGMTASIVQLNAEEMQYIESRKLNREEVCAAYDVPPPAVHILDKATFSNITEQLRSMYRDTMAPRYELFESVVDHHLVPDFYPAGTVFTKFNMDEVLRGDFETRAVAVASLVNNGVLKPSEGRTMFNLPPVDQNADQLFGNAALVPLGSNALANRPIATDGTPIPEPLPAPKAVAPLTVRSLMGRVSRVKASPSATRDKLVEEHTRELTAFFAKQKTAVLDAASKKASGLFTPSDWDDELSGILSTLSTGTAKVVGDATAKKLGSSFDGDAITGWVDDTAKKSAKKINATTADQISAAADDLDDDDDLDETLSDTFDGPISSRASEIAATRFAVVAGFATLVAGQQSGAATKTWNVDSGNPRASHAAMDGETVGVDELFSNGMNAPGDPAGGVEEVAGCTCGISFNF